MASQKTRLVPEAGLGGPTAFTCFCLRMSVVGAASCWSKALSLKLEKSGSGSTATGVSGAGAFASWAGGGSVVGVVAGGDVSIGRPGGVSDRSTGGSKGAAGVATGVKPGASDSNGGTIFSGL